MIYNKTDLKRYTEGVFCTIGDMIYNMDTPNKTTQWWFWKKKAKLSLVVQQIKVNNETGIFREN